MLLATFIKGFWNQKRTYCTKHMALHTWVPTSRKMLTDMMSESQMILEAIWIFNKVIIGTHNWEFIDAIIQNLLQADFSCLLSDRNDLEADLV